MTTRDLTAFSRSRKRVALGIAGAALVVGACLLWRLSSALATPPAQAATNAPTPATTTTTVTGSSAPATAQIVFTTVPPSNATVTWGKTVLGRITPQRGLYVTRPRDSGPLDVTVRAPGYLPVHTRAHTFADTRIAVKLTRPDQKQTLFGYRAPIDAGTPEEEAVPPGTSVGLDLQQPPL